jgi:ParB family chromosome partitioning protein
LKGSSQNIRLNSYDDIFSTEETRIVDEREKVMEIPLTELFSFRNHPFKVLDDVGMQDTVDSIKDHGVLVPAIVRPREDGGYELISGHRRKRACEMAGLDTMPVIIRNLDDDAATIIMVDSNIQRENILPSERALAYKMKLEALKRQAGRPSKENCDQLGHNFLSKRSVDIIAENAPDSRTQIQRYIRLTELAPDLLDMVDAKKIAFNPAVELSYLKPEEQAVLMTTMDREQAKPSLSQAQRLKKVSQQGHLTADSLLAIMSEDKKSDLEKVTISGAKLKKYFSKSYSQQQIEDVILKLLDQWKEKQQSEQEC